MLVLKNAKIRIKEVREEIGRWIIYGDYYLISVCNISSDSTAVFAYLFYPAIFANNTTYRLYYGIYSLSNGLFYKGHGDIKISR
ncbi:MAG: hypothetical protein ABIY62_02210 [Ginsengibacter sp.]